VQILIFLDQFTVLIYIDFFLGVNQVSSVCNYIFSLRILMLLHAQG